MRHDANFFDLSKRDKFSIHLLHIKTATTILVHVHQIAASETDQQRDQGEPHVTRVTRGLTVVNCLKGFGVPASEDENRQCRKNQWEVVIVHLLRRWPYHFSRLFFL